MPASCARRSICDGYDLRAADAEGGVVIESLESAAQQGVAGQQAVAPTGPNARVERLGPVPTGEALANVRVPIIDAH